MQELDKYINAGEELKRLNEEYNLKREAIFSGCYNQIHVENNDIYHWSYGTDQAGLRLVELSEVYEKKSKRLQRMERDFKAALKGLAEDELEAFLHTVYGHPTRYHVTAVKYLYGLAYGKLVDYLSILKDEHAEQRERERKQTLIKTIAN